MSCVMSAPAEYSEDELALIGELGLSEFLDSARISPELMYGVCSPRRKSGPLRAPVSGAASRLLKKAKSW